MCTSLQGTPNTTGTINCKALNAAAAYPGWEYKFDTKTFHFNEKFQRQKNPDVRFIPSLLCTAAPIMIYRKRCWYL